MHNIMLYCVLADHNNLNLNEPVLPDGRLKPTSAPSIVCGVSDRDQLGLTGRKASSPNIPELRSGRAANPSQHQEGFKALI